MSNNIVLFLGAGFSVDAKIPIQNKILKEMQKDPPSFSDENLSESVKFLEVFIDVGFFILNAFTKNDLSGVRKKKQTICYIKQWKELLLQTENTEKYDALISIANKFNDEFTKEFFMSLGTTGNEDSIRKSLCGIFEAHFYKLLVELKEDIRKRLVEEDPKVDLEDIFTLFDKSFRENENWHSLTYVELDKLRHSILRLFTYYFGLRIQEFDKSKTTAYDGFVEFCKAHSASIITTNWDTVVETVFSKKGIGFSTQEESYQGEDNVDVIKLHGSINWMKCNACGRYLKIENKELYDCLLNDSKTESCKLCNSTAEGDQIILQPEIITPTMLKTLNSKLYREIWSLASERLAKAEEIIFVGYSLPLADFEIRYLLKKNISTNAKIKVVLIKNDMPKKGNLAITPEMRYKTLFSSNEIEFHYEGSKNFFKNMI